MNSAPPSSPHIALQAASAAGVHISVPSALHPRPRSAGVLPAAKRLRGDEDAAGASHPSAAVRRAALEHALRLDAVRRCAKLEAQRAPPVLSSPGARIHSFARQADACTWMDAMTVHASALVHGTDSAMCHWKLFSMELPSRRADDSSATPSAILQPAPPRVREVHNTEGDEPTITELAAGQEGNEESRLVSLPPTASRRFFVARLDTFWKAYLATPPLARHWYEMCREDTPAHLYFDLEFPRAQPAVATEAGDGVDSLPPSSSPLPAHGRAASDVDAGNRCVATLLHAVATRLFVCYGIAIHAGHVVHLESTTHTKFSRHLIVRCPDGARFRSVAHVGAFVLQLMRDAQRAAAGGDAAARELWMRDAAQPHRALCVVDMGVYTRNRAMRMYLSCKQGKRAVLMPAAANRFGEDVPSSFTPLQREYWMSVCTGGVSACARRALSAEAAEEVLVQTGSAAWERDLWRHSLITDDLPPLWLTMRALLSHVAEEEELGISLPTAGAPSNAWPPAGGARRRETNAIPPAVQPPACLMEEVSAEASRVAEHDAFRPSSHPTLGWRLLYANLDALPSDAADALAVLNECEQADTEHGRSTTSHGAPLRQSVHAAGRQLQAMDATTVQQQQRPPCPSSNGAHGARTAVQPQPVPPQLPCDAPAALLSSHDMHLRSRLAAGVAASPAPALAAVVPPRVRSGVQLTPPPLPALCAHVCNLASGPLPGVPPPSAAPGVDPMLLRPAAAQVRAWSAVYDAVDGRMTRLVLEMRGSRWCNRVQRHHKSNAVRWSIYLQPGVAVQTCWDADCIAAAYSSPPVRLPPHLLPDALHATPAAPAPPSDGLSTNTL